MLGDRQKTGYLTLLVLYEFIEFYVLFSKTFCDILPLNAHTNVRFLV